MRLAFAGTPAFAEVALRALGDAGHELALVLTQPDRPAGRGQKLQASPVKQLAHARGWPLAQPRSLRLDGRFADDAAHAREALQQAAPELMVVAAYGLILPRWVLEWPRLGCLNIHASLLPRWRGAAPIHRAIEAGDAQTGITLMQMDEGLDTGAVVAAEPVEIGPDDTTASLHDRLAALGARMTVSTLAGLASGQALASRPQGAEGVTYAAKVDKAEARLDWRLPARVLERRIRAFDPFPGAHFEHAGQTVKVWQAQLQPGAGEPGTVIEAAHGRLVVACAGDTALALTTLQRPGGRRIGVTDFLRGDAPRPGDRLG